MIDEREVREMLHRRADTIRTIEVDTPTAVRRARRRLALNGAVATVAAAAIAVATLGGVDAIRNAPIPADEPTPTGIFAPVAGRIVYVNDGIDRGYEAGLWAVDPDSPADPMEGPIVADEIASDLVQLSPVDARPLGWSRDGTELLIMRTSPQPNGPVLGLLSILHADGSETPVTTDPMFILGATISPDGSRVVFAGETEGGMALYAVDAHAGPAEALLEREDSMVYEPTFSPDGTQIAYVDGGGDHTHHVWVMNADGSDAHEIVFNEWTAVGHVQGLAWSPAGDRIALGLVDSAAIYTFAPDGSDFTQVIPGGARPYWSPDGSQIAYTIWDPLYGPAGLAIADADGSNVREFGFGASGPWISGVSATDDPAPTGDVGEDGVLRSEGEVLGFTGEPGGEPGDLVAVDPGSGEERVLVEDLETVYSARWSADGRWVAYEAPGPEGIGLWVVSASQEPRQVATGASILAWSSTGAELATIQLTPPLHTNIAGSTLSTIDPLNGETIDAGSIPEGVGDVTSAPAWSPDLTRFVFGARGGAIYSIDVRSGARSLLVRLPGEHLDSVDQITWSPDGAHIAVMMDGKPGGLYVMDGDGSNVRLLLDNYSEAGVAWSPDGTRLAYENGSGVVWVASIDGSAPTEIGPLSASCNALLCQEDLIWSPDGSRIAFRTIAFGAESDVSVDVSAIDADGQGDAERIDELTYRSWDGGSYSCECT